MRRLFETVVAPVIAGARELPPVQPKTPLGYARRALLLLAWWLASVLVEALFVVPRLRGLGYAASARRWRL